MVLADCQYRDTVDRELFYRGIIKTSALFSRRSHFLPNAAVAQGGDADEEISGDANERNDGEANTHSRI